MLGAHQLCELTLKLGDLGAGGYPTGRQHSRRCFARFEADLRLRERDPSLVVRLLEDCAQRAPHRSCMTSLFMPLSPSPLSLSTTANRGGALKAVLWERRAGLLGVWAMTPISGLPLKDT